MKYNPQIHHRRSSRLKGYDYTQAGAYFITIATQGRACLFGEVRDGEMRLSAVGKIVQWEWMRLEEKFPPVKLGACVVMPNHIHGIMVIHAAERSPRHGTAEPNAEPHVGATQAGQPGEILAAQSHPTWTHLARTGRPAMAPSNRTPNRM